MPAQARFHSHAPALEPKGRRQVARGERAIESQVTERLCGHRRDVSDRAQWLRSVNLLADVFLASDAANLVTGAEYEVTAGDKARVSLGDAIALGTRGGFLTTFCILSIVN